MELLRRASGDVRCSFSVSRFLGKDVVPGLLPASSHAWIFWRLLEVKAFFVVSLKDQIKLFTAIVSFFGYVK